MGLEVGEIDVEVWPKVYFCVIFMEELKSQFQKVLLDI